MHKGKLDYKLLIGIILSFLLLFITYENIKVFWYMYTATMLFLISYSIINEKIDDHIPASQYFSIGILSGVFLYLLFAVGNWIISFLPGNFHSQVNRIYETFELEWAWHYLVLIFIIIPGEELFWRGFVLKRFMRFMSIPKALMATALLNSIILIVSGYYVLMLAAFISCIVWGALYIWKRSMPLLIVSHLTFDILLLIIFPIM